MHAVVVTPGSARSARLVEHPDPIRRAGECLVRVLEVGIDGTDREIDAGEYGEPPAGEDVLVLGHESVGEVVEPAAGRKGPAAGELVVATVRRPDPAPCLNCRAGEYDFCLTDEYLERGIKGLHGFLAEQYAELPEFLVPIPRELRRLAVMVEPLSIVEKVLRHVELIQRRMRWEPSRLLVTGAGSIGILQALLARLRGWETVVYSRGKPEGARAEILGVIGATYVSSDDHSLEETAERHGAPDIIVEATGYSPLAWQAAGVLATNGIACLLSVTGGDMDTEIASDELNRRMVLRNQLLFGSVNAHRRDFEKSIEDLTAIERRWPGLLERGIVRRSSLEEVPVVLAEKDKAVVKTAITVSGGE